MKKQKLISNLPADSQGCSIAKVIIDYLNQKKILEDSIKIKESQLAEELKSIFKQDENFELLDKFFKLIVCSQEERGPSQYIGTLLDAICNQIAHSLKRHYYEPEDKAVGFINWGSRFYTVDESELIEYLKCSSRDKAVEQFKVFNEHVEKYDVHIILFGKNEHEAPKPLLFDLRIFN